MRLLVLHGPNINLIGRREPHIYGTVTLEQIDRRLAALAAELGATLTTVQSNHEGVLLDTFHQHRETAAGALLNAGGLTHSSVALLDCIKAMPFPVLEVHLSNIAAREEWRRHSLIAPACRASIAGLGWRSYTTALRALVELLRDEQGTV